NGADFRQQPGEGQSGAGGDVRSIDRRPRDHKRRGKAMTTREMPRQLFAELMTRLGGMQDPPEAQRRAVRMLSANPHWTKEQYRAALMADDAMQWYAQRPLNRLIAMGVLVRAGADEVSPGPRWDEFMSRRRLQVVAGTATETADPAPMQLDLFDDR